jgi:hypothetical protein
MKMRAFPIFMIANNAVMKHEDSNEIYHFTLLVTPYRRYLKVPSNNNLLFKSLRPDYVMKNKGFSTNLAYLYEMSIEVWKVLDGIRSAVITEEGCPRFHESSWQSTHAIERVE